MNVTASCVNLRLPLKHVYLLVKRYSLCTVQTNRPFNMRPLTFGLKSGEISIVPFEFTKL